MLARRRTAGLRGSFRPHLPWTKALSRPQPQTRAGTCVDSSTRTRRRTARAAAHHVRATAATRTSSAPASSSTLAAASKRRPGREHVVGQHDAPAHLPHRREACPRRWRARATRPSAALVARLGARERLERAGRRARRAIARRDRAAVVEPAPAQRRARRGHERDRVGPARPLGRDLLGEQGCRAPRRAGARPRPCEARPHARAAARTRRAPAPPRRTTRGSSTRCRSGSRRARHSAGTRPRGRCAEARRGSASHSTAPGSSQPEHRVGKSSSARSSSSRIRAPFARVGDRYLNASS